MEYTENEMLNKDIDWFIRVRSELIHVASAGTFLPKIIQYAKEDNEERFKFIRKQQDCYSNIDVEINPLLREILHIEEYVDEYSLVLEALNIPLGNDIIYIFLHFQNMLAKDLFLLILQVLMIITPSCFIGLQGLNQILLKI